MIVGLLGQPASDLLHKHNYECPVYTKTRKFQAAVCDIYQLTFPCKQCSLTHSNPTLATANLCMCSKSVTYYPKSFIKVSAKSFIIRAICIEASLL